MNVQGASITTTSPSVVELGDEVVISSSADARTLELEVELTEFGRAFLAARRRDV